MNQACAVLYLSIQDNVLSAEDWPILKVVLNAYGWIIDKKVVKFGVYAMDHVGIQNLADIDNWLAFDGEESHPAIYHVLVPAP